MPKNHIVSQQGDQVVTTKQPNEDLAASILSKQSICKLPTTPLTNRLAILDSIIYTILLREQLVRKLTLGM